MKLKPWAKMPTGWIQDGQLKQFDWEERSEGTAALMIYFTMCQFAAERQLRPSEKSEPPKAAVQDPLPVQDATLSPQPRAEGNSQGWGIIPPPQGTAQMELTPVKPHPAALSVVSPSETNGLAGEAGASKGQDEYSPEYLIVRLTYNEIGTLTGLSRAKISAGLKKLIRERMIWCVDESSSYGLVGSGAGMRWAKLPGNALLSVGRTEFSPFKHFTLRSKHELNALKLHLYYANARSRENAYCEVSYPIIRERTGVPERDIPRANSFLISCGILQRTRGLPGHDVRQHESNKYYLTGYEGFSITKKAA